jgi:O-antigen ligase/Flp pilus assembly protein TadD
VTLGLLIKNLWTDSATIVPAPTLRESSLLVVAGLFTCWIAASVLWAGNPYSAAHYAFQWSAYLIFFALMRTVVARPRVLRASLHALAVVIWLLCISCLIESLFGAALTDHGLRLTAKPLFRGFSGFGEVMGVAAPIFAGLALHLRKPRTALLCGATALMAWLATLQALERAPILGCTAGLVLLVGGVVLKPNCRKRGLRRVALFVTGLLLVTGLQFTPSLLNREASPENLTALQRFQNTSLAETNTGVRLLFWGTGLEMFRRHPVLGVGANNYEVGFPQARAQFAAEHMNNPVIALNEELLTQYAHNEYLQILAELGVIGFFLFAAFCLMLVLAFWFALRRARHPLLVLGSGGGLLAFAISSGASAFSFRWLGSGLIFFFAAALVSHFANQTTRPAETAYSSSHLRLALGGGLIFAVLMSLGAAAQGVNSILHASAQSNSSSPDRSEHSYRLALRFNPFDAATHYDYGILLYQQHRSGEAVKYLRSAVEHGINTSTAYASLAATEEDSGDLEAAEHTLAFATRVYPASVFLIVRHAAALARIKRAVEADKEFASAMTINPRLARGWYQLINFDIDAASTAARWDQTIATPGELEPEGAVFTVLAENERRLKLPPLSGVRGRIQKILN